MQATSKMTDKEVDYIRIWGNAPMSRDHHVITIIVVLRLPDSFIIHKAMVWASGQGRGPGQWPALQALRMFFLIASEIDSVRSRIVVFVVQ